MLVKCDACDSDVSSEANMCMTCGHPLNTTHKVTRHVKSVCLSCGGKVYLGGFFLRQKCHICGGHGYIDKYYEEEVPLARGWHKP